MLPSLQSSLQRQQWPFIFRFFIKDHQEHTLKFIQDARQHWEYRAFQAELDGKPIGTAACQVGWGRPCETFLVFYVNQCVLLQVFHALYPSIIVGSDRSAVCLHFLMLS